jgi:hypothetical protein
MEQTIEEMKKSYPNVKGWGVDADPKNNPTYPIKRRTNGEQRGYSWERPPQQEATVEVLHSNERPNLSAAFGTSTPPSGLSGMLRRFAFRFSESSYGHWLPLMLADRVNMVEGCVHDLLHGKVPNPMKECGWRVELQHNRKAFVTRLTIRALVVGAVVGGVVALNRRSRNRNRVTVS